MSITLYATLYSKFTIWIIKGGSPTTQCIFSTCMLEIIDYYNFDKSNVNVLMVDSSKVFDRIKYCKLFAALLERDISPIVIRLLLFMYNNQFLLVKWSNTLSDKFSVMNGVKWDGVLSPIIFAVYTNGLLEAAADWSWLPHG